MKTVIYLRVSTASQGRSGLGLDAQRAAVAQFCNGRGCEVLAEFVEVESGKDDDRPKLAQALHHAKITGAVLVVAKLDRLSRDIAFLTALQKSGAKFIAADMPEANELTVHIMAAVAQAERKAISTRTKEALAAAKVRAAADGIGRKADGTPWKTGNRLGNPNGAAPLRRAAKGTTAALEAVTANADAHAENLRTTVARHVASGTTSLPALAKALNDGNITTRRGGRWHPSSVRNLLARLGRGDAVTQGIFAGQTHEI